MNIRLLISFLIAFLSLTVCSTPPTRAETLDWIRQFGHAGFGFSDALGNVYISWSTNQWNHDADERDAYIAKYEESGTLEWTEQIDSGEWDFSVGVAPDGLGGAYIAGYTTGSLDAPNAGAGDVFVRKYDASGALEWGRQLGTRHGDNPLGMSADELGVYITGRTYQGSLGGPNAGSDDAFLIKYDPNGDREWTSQLGTPTGDMANAVSPDGLGNVYIVGDTWGSLEGSNAGLSDVFLTKYDASGTLEWTRQFGDVGWDRGTTVSADALGNVYVAGWLDRDLTGGGGYGLPGRGGDRYVAKYDASGTREWIQYFGYTDAYRISAVSADGLGNVYVAGSTDDDLAGTNAGDIDAFVSKYDAGGTLMWTQQFGTSDRDGSNSVSVDGLGHLYILGWTAGSFAGPNAGSGEVFLAKITDVSQPLLGDVNLDGQVDGLDVDPFVDVLLNGPFQPAADMNADGIVNGLDVAPFVSTVVTGLQQVPEPSTLLLCLMALGILGGRRKLRGRAGMERSRW